LYISLTCCSCCTTRKKKGKRDKTQSNGATREVAKKQKTRKHEKKQMPVHVDIAKVYGGEQQCRDKARASRKRKCARKGEQRRERRQRRKQIQGAENIMQRGGDMRRAQHESIASHLPFSNPTSESCRHTPTAGGNRRGKYDSRVQSAR
jgi:hypothetical protein